MNEAIENFVYFCDSMKIATEGGYHGNKKLMKRQLKSFKTVKKFLEDPSIPAEDKIDLAWDISSEIDETIKEIKNSKADSFDNFVDISSRLLNKVLYLGSIVADYVIIKKVNPKLSYDTKYLADIGIVTGTSMITNTICTINQQNNTNWYKARKKSIYIEKLEDAKKEVEKILQFYMNQK